MISNKTIKNLKPCSDRFNNYLKYYKDKTHTYAQFLGLKNITHDDKLWVTLRLIPEDKLRFLAADIAELVLYAYEREYPNDFIPRKAIEAARAIPFDKERSKEATASTLSHAYSISRYADDSMRVIHTIYAAYYAVKASCTEDFDYAIVCTNTTALHIITTTKGNTDSIKKRIRTIVLNYLNGKRK